MAQSQTDYFYRSQRRGKQVVRTYYGQGPTAELVRDSHKLQRTRHAGHNSIVQSEQSLLQRAFEDLRSTRLLVELLVDAAMLSIAMRRTRRHFWQPWRAGRHWLTISRGNGRPTYRPSAGSQAITKPAVVYELRMLIRDANAGDPTSCPRIRELLETQGSIWNHVTLHVRQTKELWHDLAVAMSSPKRDLDTEFADVRSQFDCNNPKLVVEILLDWTEVLWLVREWATVWGPLVGRRTWRVKVRERWANCRFLKTLATFGRLAPLLPSIRPSDGPPGLYRPSQAGEGGVSGRQPA